MLIAGVMGQDCIKFLPMCLESLKDADKIVYIDGGSKDNSVEYAESKGCETIVNEYNQNDFGMNGKQRNKFLDYIKRKYNGGWCIFCDADEVVEDLVKIKEFIQEAQEGLYSVKMRHFIGDLGHEDTTVPEHYAPNRLFKISEAREYPEVEHPVLIPKDMNKQYRYKGTTIWHLAYVPNMWEIKKRYLNHLKKSNMHTPEFLGQWYRAHLFGQYPKTEINLIDIPEIILKEFGIDKDEFYFQNRGLEIRHFLMAGQWYNKFKPKSVLDLGCGFGPYGVPFANIGCQYKGIEKSEYAVRKNPFKLDIYNGDLTKGIVLPNSFDLVLVLDVLEHLEEEQLEFALKLISGVGEKYIFSIPFLGDSNLYKDSTHRIFKEKRWWIEKLSKYFKIKKTPENWLFHEQIIIGENVRNVGKNSIPSKANVENTVQKNVQQ